MKNTKHYLLYLLNLKLIVILFSFNLFAQTDKIEIKNSIDLYFQTIKAKDNANTLEFLYPKIFEAYPKEMLPKDMTAKEMMLKALNSMYEDSNMIFNFDNSKIIKISNIETIDSIKYALVKYSYDLKITFLENEKDTTQNKYFDLKEIILLSMKNEHGEKNAVLDKNTNIITVFVTNDLYAIDDPLYKGWKFIEKKKNLEPIIEKILPIKKLKN